MIFANSFYLWLQLTTVAKASVALLSYIAHAPFYPLCDVYIYYL